MESSFKAVRRPKQPRALHKGDALVSLCSSPDEREVPSRENPLYRTRKNRLATRQNHLEPLPNQCFTGKIRIFSAQTKDAIGALASKNLQNRTPGFQGRQKICCAILSHLRSGGEVSTSRAKQSRCKHAPRRSPNVRSLAAQTF